MLLSPLRSQLRSQLVSKLLSQLRGHGGTWVRVGLDVGFVVQSARTLGPDAGRQARAARLGLGVPSPWRLSKQPGRPGRQGWPWQAPAWGRQKSENSAVQKNVFRLLRLYVEKLARPDLRAEAPEAGQGGQAGQGGSGQRGQGPKNSPKP